MTSTEEEQTVVNVTPVTTTPATAQQAAKTPNIKRNLSLYQYSLTATTKILPLRRLLGKKCWREVKAIIYEDSTLKVFEDAKLRDTVFEIKLEDVALYLAFGKAANKYGPPPITEEEVNYIAPNNFFAIPENKDREKIHWFAAKDEQNLKDLVQAIAETVDGKVNPPQLGKGPKYRYSSDELDSKWKTYWMTQMTTAQQVEPEENGSENKFVATPLVAVLEQQKEQQKLASPPTQAKNGTAKKEKAKPMPQPRQPRDYYHVAFEVPEKVETLRHQSEDGLMDDNVEADKTVVVRMVHGKRVREIVANQKKQEELSPAPPDYPPPPIPTVVLEENKVANTEPKRGQVSPKIEVVTLVKEEPLIISTKCFNIESFRPPSDPGAQEQTVEVVTSQHNAVINIASVEHTVPKSSEFVVKETAISFQETTNGHTTVH